MSDTCDLGSWIIVYIVENGGKYHVDPSHWDELDAAYGYWIERRIDRVLTVTASAGNEIRFAASRISDMCMSTPEARERARQLEAAEKAESGFEG